MKRIQNEIAESGLTLPVVAALAAILWIAKGGIAHQWWPQLACFALTVYLIVELSNSNALLRIRSRMVSTVFIVLSCTASFLFHSIAGNVLQLCLVASLLFWFQSYQDDKAAGKVYYAFLFYGIASLCHAQLLWLLPVLWVLMGTQLQALNGRLLLASLLGVATPYWIVVPVVLIFDPWPQLGFQPEAHVQALLSFMNLTEAYATWTVNRVAVVAFVTVLLGMSIFHFWTNSFEDKIRIRLLYGLFTVMSLLSIIALLLQPQHYDMLIRMVFIYSSPLIGHYFALTSGKATNYVFLTACGLALALIIFNLWMPSLNF